MPVSVAAAIGASIAAITAGVVILAALCGWGWLAARIVSPRRRLDPATAASLGLGVFLAACGPVELLQAARPALFWAFGAIGVAATAITAGRVRPRLPRIGSALTILLIPLLAVQLAYLADVSWWRFDGLDDLHGYLVMPTRILQSGSTGRDPFLFRRVESGLGGGAYLYALFMTALDFTQLRMADLGLGSMVVFLAVASHASHSARGLRMLPLAAGAALVAILFMPVVNLAPDALAIGVLYAALRLSWGVARSARIDLGDHLLLALLLFALVCLRSTYAVPAAALFMALYGSMAVGRSRRAVLTAGLGACLLMLGLALPWMAVLDAIAGTPFYPFLGFGTLSHDEVASHADIAVFLKLCALVLTCYLLAASSVLTIAVARDVLARERLFLILVTVAMLALVALSSFKFTVYAFRYSYVGIVTLPLFLFTESLHHEARLPRWRWSRAGVLAALAVFVLALGRHRPDAFINGRLSMLLGRTADGTAASASPVNASDPVQRAALREQLRAMQQAVPPGQLILVRLDAPFLLDFIRNPIWVMDHPGQIGPAPGVPAEASVAAWRPYLQRLGVSYVAYSYGDEAGDSVALGEAFTKGLPAPSHWQDKLQEKVGLMHAMLDKLPASNPVVFDDGQRYVVALTTPPP